MLYERIKKLAAARGYTIKDLEESLGFSRGYIYKFNTHSPSVDKIRQIASFLKVPVAALFDDEWHDEWYLDEETAIKAQELFKNKEMRELFMAAKDAKPENLQTVTDVLLAMRRRGQDNGDDPS